MNDVQIKHMVDRFLGWRLPEDFNPDAGITFERFDERFSSHRPKHEPTGTNLLDASQAEALVRHLTEGLPEDEDAIAKWREALIQARALLMDRCNASAWYNDCRMYELFHNVLEPLIGRVGY